jgi:hypothetical protein
VLSLKTLRARKRVKAMGQDLPEGERPSPPASTGPLTNVSSSPEGLKLASVILRDGLVLVCLEPTLRIKVFDLEGDPVREVLNGARLTRLEEILGYRCEVYAFRVKGECFKAVGQRFKVWCSDLAEHLRPDVIGPTKWELEDLLKSVRYVDPSKIRYWVNRLLQLDEELSRVDVELSKLLAGVVQVESGDLAPVDFHDRVNWLKDRIVDLVNSQELEEMDARGKVMKIFEVISKHFEFIRIPSENVDEEPEVYALDGDVLRPIEDVLKPVVGALVKAGMVRKSVLGDLELATYSTSRITSWRNLNPWDKIRLKNGVLDLRELRLLNKTDYYFTYRLDVSITEEELREIRDGSYRVEDNPVYRSWRSHFEDEEWDYLVDSLGTWLAPFRFKHIAFLIGPRNSGKSTLLLNLTEPINPLVARTSLRNIVDNRFGLQPLIGKQVLVHSERGDVVLKNLDIVNNLLGESDYIPVDRKHLPIVNIRSLKAAMFSMNDPPILYEQGGETLAAFLERLSIIFMRAPEDFKPIKNFRVDPKEALKFLLWCRIQLESRGWEIRKRDFEEKLDYLTKMANTALRFLEESDYIIKDPYSRVKGTDLYEAYKKWCMEQGIAPMGLVSFYHTVATKYTRYEPGNVVWFKGLRLRVREGLEVYK